MNRRSFVLTATAGMIATQLPRLAAADVAVIQQAWPDQPVYFHCLDLNGAPIPGMGCPTFLRWIDGIYRPDPTPFFCPPQPCTVDGFTIQLDDGSLLLDHGTTAKCYYLLTGDVLLLNVTLGFAEA